MIFGLNLASNVASKPNLTSGKIVRGRGWKAQVEHIKRARKETGGEGWQ